MIALKSATHTDAINPNGHPKCRSAHEKHKGHGNRVVIHYRHVLTYITIFHARENGAYNFEVWNGALGQAGNGHQITPVCDRTERRHLRTQLCGDQSRLRLPQLRPAQSGTFARSSRAASMMVKSSMPACAYGGGPRVPAPSPIATHSNSLGFFSLLGRVAHGRSSV